MTENRPSIHDHDLMRMVRARVNQDPPIPMTQIASEVGYDVDVLCAWIMAYKEPKKHKPVDNSKYGPAIAPRTAANRAKDFVRYRAAYAGAPARGA